MSRPRNSVEPRGHEHEFGVDELFFSTTDRKGVIEQANTTFVRLSHYDHEDLVGAPHNIIRHPDMPGGAFKLVWDQIEAGRPACAYVKNLAQDGGAYWVFATLLPVGDKYLSVRKRPLVSAYRNASDNLYAIVRPEELERREKGAGRDDAAGYGLGRLVEGLTPLGLTSADDLTLTFLPAEMAEHDRQSAGLPHRPDATGPLAELLATMHAVDAQVRPWTARLDEYAGLVDALEQARVAAAPTIDRLVGIAAAAAEGTTAAESTEEFLAGQSERMSALAETAIDRFEELDRTLTDVQGRVRWLRMRIALLRLHDIMVGTFTAELIDGSSTTDAVESVDLLCRALDEGAADLAEQFRVTTEAMRRLPELVQDTVGTADRMLRFATKWRGTVETEELGGRVGTQLARIEELRDGGFEALEQCYAVAARTAALTVPFDEAALDALVGQMRAAIHQEA